MLKRQLVCLIFLSLLSGFGGRISVAQTPITGVQPPFTDSLFVDKKPASPKVRCGDLPLRRDGGRFTINNISSFPLFSGLWVD